MTKRNGQYPMKTPKKQKIAQKSYFSGKKGKTRKRMIIIFAVIALLLAVLAAVSALLGHFAEKAAEGNRVGSDTEERYFYEPKPGEDIENDEEYLEKIRDITYHDEYGRGILITDGDYLSKGGVGLQLLSYYFDAVKTGKSSVLNVLFSKEYLTENGEFPDFRPQRVYDINVQIESRETDEETGDTTIVYTVWYKIMKNDGSFRRDIGRDSFKKQYFTVCETDDDVVITDISPVVSLFT